MNHAEIDMLIVGATLGTVPGAWLGYQLRKIVVRVRDHKRRVEFHDGPVAVGRSTLREQRARDVMREKQVIPIVPTNARGRGKVTITEVANPNRDEVVAALVGAGYKKTAANAAVDACSLAERASGVEAWTVCALRHAHGAK